MGILSFALAFDRKKLEKEVFESEKFLNIPVEIHAIFPEFILVRLPKYFYQRIFPYYGIKVRVNNQNCILDGGIPHYKIGTVISHQKFNSDTYSSIFLGTDKIGTLRETNGQFGFFKFDLIKFLLNDKEIRGISLYLANFLPLIKIIPNKKNEFSFKPRSVQYLTMSSRNL
jgi:hypothetical protein